ncbi:MAG: hypothetical protein AB7O57_10715, partial [Hyphomicrobiaceae bacterium]
MRKTTFRTAKSAQRHADQRRQRLEAELRGGLLWRSLESRIAFDAAMATAADQVTAEAGGGAPGDNGHVAAETLALGSTQAIAEAFAGRDGG